MYVKCLFLKTMLNSYIMYHAYKCHTKSVVIILQSQFILSIGLRGTSRDNLLRFRRYANGIANGFYDIEISWHAIL